MPEQVVPVIELPGKQDTGVVFPVTSPVPDEKLLQDVDPYVDQVDDEHVVIATPSGQ